jgi:hypothetical protein
MIVSMIDSRPQTNIKFNLWDCGVSSVEIYKEFTSQNSVQFSSAMILLWYGCFRNKCKVSPSALCSSQCSINIYSKLQMELRVMVVGVGASCVEVGSGCSNVDSLVVISTSLLRSGLMKYQ